MLQANAAFTGDGFGWRVSTMLSRVDGVLERTLADWVVSAFGFADRRPGSNVVAKTVDQRP